ncbi:Lcl C-terminal domain-containing protein [Polaromonas sp.]|uniref:Lcl C-terminal domain-containing protein n=1 Tax=Polaromonas sp. TaxID=1869339 RepID=UPI002FC754E4
MKLFLLQILGLTMALSAGTAFAQDRYSTSADGQEVTDSKTGLVWRRCVEGMNWKVKTCSGKAGFFNQADAAARAKNEAASSGQAWRLPTLKELSGIVSAREASPDEGRAAIDPAAFPATPLARFWTSSSVGTGYFMHVAFTEGSAGESPRSSPGAVRLVRAGK